MTRWAMAVDLNRCIGCQTCTAACKHVNATAPGVQWRKVLDFEVGEFPDVRRAFVPVGCMHCDDPPCLDVCPSTATKKRDDGIVSIDYDICIGCSYCAVACPYQARWKVDVPNAAFKSAQMRHEIVNEREERRSVAQKCTFCTNRIDRGLKNGLTPGVDPEATPACVNSCIADALHFGDIEDPQSNVSKQLSEHKYYQMHEEVGTGPGLFYLWNFGSAKETSTEPALMVADPVGASAVSPKLQTSWDWRAAANFIFGGAGTGLFAAATIAGYQTGFSWLAALIAMALVGAGLFCVWLEIGRPWRFLNVYLHAKRSWMTREAFAAVPFFGLGILAAYTSSPVIWFAAAGLGLVFLYCQGRILQAAKGIPAWRQDEIVPLIVATGLTEGLGLFAIIAMVAGLDESALNMVILALLVLVLIRYFAWYRYRKSLGQVGAPTKTFEELDRGILNLSLKTQLLVLVVVAAGLAIPAMLVPGGLLALLSGWVFKFTLITRAAFDQGYAVERMPARGAGDSGPGIKPGWTLS